MSRGADGRAGSPGSAGADFCAEVGVGERSRGRVSASSGGADACGAGVWGEGCGGAAAACGVARGGGEGVAVSDPQEGGTGEVSVVQARVGEPAGAGHGVAIDRNPLAAALGDAAAMVPQREPEAVAAGDGPATQRRVVRQPPLPASRPSCGNGSSPPPRRAPRRAARGYRTCPPAYPRRRRVSTRRDRIPANLAGGGPLDVAADGSMGESFPVNVSLLPCTCANGKMRAGGRFGAARAGCIWK